MKTAILFKVLGDCPAMLEIPGALVVHAKRNNKESLQNRDHQTLRVLSALQEAV